MKFIIYIGLILAFSSCNEGSESAHVKGEWSKLLNPNENKNKTPQNEEVSHNSRSRFEEDSKPTLSVSDAHKKSNFQKKTEVREQLVKFSEKFLGVPYLYASSDPQVGFDCSGFINYVYKSFNFNVPRTTKDFSNFGMNVEINEVKKGDLLIFTGTEPNSMEIGHIGIVLHPKGMQSDFIHASSGKASGVTVSSLASEHYTKRFVKAISVID